MKDMPVSFPGLFGDWELNIDPVAIHVGHGIYWYWLSPCWRDCTCA